MVFPRVPAIGDVTSGGAAVRTQQEWVDQHTAKYWDYSGFASFGTDAALMLHKAVAKAGGTDGPKLRDTLENPQLRRHLRPDPQHTAGALRPPTRVTRRAGGTGRQRASRRLTPPARTPAPPGAPGPHMPYAALAGRRTADAVGASAADRDSP